MGPLSPLSSDDQQVEAEREFGAGSVELRSPSEPERHWDFADPLHSLTCDLY